MGRHVLAVRSEAGVNAGTKLAGRYLREVKRKNGKRNGDSPTVRETTMSSNRFPATLSESHPQYTALAAPTLGTGGQSAGSNCRRQVNTIPGVTADASNQANRTTGLAGHWL